MVSYKYNHDRNRRDKYVSGILEKRNRAEWRGEAANGASASLPAESSVSGSESLPGWRADAARLFCACGRSKQMHSLREMRKVLPHARFEPGIAVALPAIADGAYIEQPIPLPFRGIGCSTSVFCKRSSCSNQRMGCYLSVSLLKRCFAGISAVASSSPST